MLFVDLAVCHDGTLVDDEFEIYGKSVFSPDHTEIDNDRRITITGVDGDPGNDALSPDIAYAGISWHSYFLVWQQTEMLGPTTDKTEVYGRALGLGGYPHPASNRIKISTTGVASGHQFDVYRPTLARGPTVNQYLVSWDANNPNYGLVDNHREIFLQIVDVTTERLMLPVDRRWL